MEKESFLKRERERGRYGGEIIISDDPVREEESKKEGKTQEGGTMGERSPLSWGLAAHRNVIKIPRGKTMPLIGADNGATMLMRKIIIWEFIFFLQKIGCRGWRRRCCPPSPRRAAASTEGRVPSRKGVCNASAKWSRRRRACTTGDAFALNTTGTPHPPQRVKTSVPRKCFVINAARTLPHPRPESSSRVRLAIRRALSLYVCTRVKGETKEITSTNLLEILVVCQIFSNRFSIFIESFVASRFVRGESGWDGPESPGS